MHYSVRFNNKIQLLYTLFGFGCAAIAFVALRFMFDLDFFVSKLAILLFLLLVLGALVGVLGIVMFAARRGDAIVMNEQSLTATIPPFGKLSIPWHEIEDFKIGIMPMNSGNSLRLHLRDHSKYTAGMTGLKQTSVKLGLQQFGTPFSIPLKFIDKNDQEVIAKALEFRARYGQ